MKGPGGRIVSCTESVPTPGLEIKWTTKKLNVNNHRGQGQAECAMLRETNVQEEFSLKSKCMGWRR